MYTLKNGWICESVEDCTCAGGTPEANGQHESHCGYVPIIAIEELVKMIENPVINSNWINLVRHWSLETFGPNRVIGVIDHLEKEINELKDSPYDLMEWADIIILGIEGAWRSGHEPQSIINAIHEKVSINQSRKWPDWRTIDGSKAIEHDRGYSNPEWDSAKESVKDI